MSARILVVDDVDVNVKVLEAKLSSEYYQVLSANDGMAALQIAHQPIHGLVAPGAVLLQRFHDHPVEFHIPASRPRRQGR